MIGGSVAVPRESDRRHKPQREGNPETLALPGEEQQSDTPKTP